MPNPNAIVSSSVRLEPPIDRGPEQGRPDAGYEVLLDEERRVRLDPSDPRSSGFAEILDGLGRQGLPVYLEVDPDTDAVTRLIVPQVGRVTGIDRSEGATLDVVLEPSHARHMLRLEGPDAGELEQRLRAALRAGQPIILIEDDAHNIIDVRDFTPLREGKLPPFLPIPLPDPHLPPRYPWPLNWVWWLLQRLKWWVRWPLWWYRCPSVTRAQQAFDDMAATSCDPLTVPAPCIPFRYPDDGCWARAHEMCRLMLAAGLSPDKVWIDASSGHWLHVSTRNHPQCYVEWGWHVAPTICVRGPLFSTRRMVIDPSLFTTPVTEIAWKGVQGDPGASLLHTGADRFWHGGGTDPAYTASNSILAQYRLALQSRSVQQGPPPYANCP